MKKAFPVKLYVGLVLSVLLVLIVGITSIMALKEQNEESGWVKHTNVVLSQLKETRYNLIQMRGARRGYWVTGNKQLIAPFTKGNTAVPAYMLVLKDYVADNPTQARNVQVLDSLVFVLLSYWQQTDVVQHSYPLEEFRKIVEEEDLILDNTYRQFELIKLDEERLLAQREEKVKRSFSRTQVIVVSGIALLLLLVLLLINGVLSTLKSRHKANLKLEENLAELERINILAKNKNWLLEGAGVIHESTRSNTGSLEDLAKSILSALVKYMEVPAGAFFVANEEQTKLLAAATIAVSQNAKNEFSFGEGIVGAAAQNKSISVVKDIPANYWKVESATGNVVGKGEIICIPLLMNDELKGVIELGTFSSFTELQKEFLQTISKNLAISVNARQARIKNEKLLIKVQEQKEEMESQQEELRQTNEELSRQAEELQASEEELKTQEEELRQINIELQERNGAIENARQAIILKAKELEETSKFKSEFLANMSHELRTPLNSVLILARLLADNKPENLTPKQVEYATIIHKSGSDLLQLINDILDLSKIEAGKVDLIIEQTNIKEIATDMQQLFTVVAAEKSISFETSFAPGIPEKIGTDKQRVEQVLKNLLSNAFKFTPNNGCIQLTFSSRLLFNKKALAISVADSGIGISPDKQKLIFEAFQQADGSTNRKYGGTGLGLSISKELTRLLAGEIELQSEEGKGSTFTIVLPMEHEVGQQVKQEASNLLQYDEVKPSLEGVEDQVLVADDRKGLSSSDKTILIIEDDVNFASIVKDFAQEKGYKAIVALQGDQGLKYARQFKPSAIILDIQLPVIDGWSLLKIFKADDELKNIPVHIISAYDDVRLHNAGALAYIKKPVDKDALENAFTSIQQYINEHLKKVLILSDSHFSDEKLQKLFSDKHPDAQFFHKPFNGSTAQLLKGDSYGCVIVDIGNDIKAGASHLLLLKQEMQDVNVPFIVFVDTDISAEDEMQLKKISNAIVRDSTASTNRLMDEMELFLYKVQQSKQPLTSTVQSNENADVNHSNKKVLLVDDDMRNVFALSAALELQNLQVVSATDGKDALDKLEQEKDFDIVLMDIMMPEMDGYTAMQKIRKEMRLTSLPIIALTAKAMAGDREKCIEAGASDYITKPIDMQKLLSLMRVWLAS